MVATDTVKAEVFKDCDNCADFTHSTRGSGIMRAPSGKILLELMLMQGL